MESRKKMSRAEYLARIGIDAVSGAADDQTLCLLQRQHLMNVPFENLDIHWKRPIVLDTDKFYQKIVEGKRGGFCYELNGMFNELLCDIGFQTRLVSARVFNVDSREFGPEFDHMVIIVSVDGKEYLTDVGFGDFIAEPLLFETDIEQIDREGTFMITKADDGSFKVAKKNVDAWVPECLFGDKARSLSEFAEMCDFQQYSPDSHFTKGKICSLMTETGRRTLTDKAFIQTVNGKRTESAIGSGDEFDRILKKEFQITRNH